MQQEPPLLWLWPAVAVACCGCAGGAGVQLQAGGPVDASVGCPARSAGGSQVPAGKDGQEANQEDQMLRGRAGGRDLSEQLLTAGLLVDRPTWQL